MADHEAAFAGVFASPVISTYPFDAAAPLVLRDESAISKLVVRAVVDSPTAAALGVTYGTSRRDGEALLCGSRPGEWTMLGGRDACQAVIATLDQSGHVSVVDLTHGRALFRLTGHDAPSVLEKLCSLDWNDAMTPDGAVMSASVAKVSCDLVRDDIDGVRSYLVACARSFGQYLFDVLIDAGGEFSVGVAAPLSST